MADYLEVTALLDLTLNGSTVAVRGSGSRLEADLPDLRTALLISKQLKRSFSALDTFLRSSGLVVYLRLQSTDVGRFGYGARATLMGRLAGYSGLELWIFPLVRAVSKSLMGSKHIGKKS